MNSPSATVAGQGKTTAVWPRSFVVLIATAGALLAWLVSLRDSLLFSKWSGADLGANLALARLLAEGLRPNIDFGFTYGPATALLCWGWGEWVDMTPAAFLGLMGLMQLLQSWLMVSIISRVGLSWWWGLVFAAGLPWFSPVEPSVAHLGERIGLLLSVANAANGRQGSALAGCAIAVGFRPSVGFILGAGLLVWIIAKGARRPREIILKVWPAVAIIGALAALSMGLWGYECFVNTVIPFTGMRMYRSMSGSVLSGTLLHLFPLGMNIRGFLGFPRLATAAALVIVLLAGMYTTILVVRDVLTKGVIKSDCYAMRILLGCFAVLILWIVFAFGGGLVYSYSAPFQWLGLFAAAASTRWSAIFAKGVALAGVANILVFTALALRLLWGYGGTEYHRVTNVAMVSAADTDELQQLAKIVGDDYVTYLPYMGDQKVFGAAGFRLTTPRYWCLSNDGVATPAESATLLETIRSGKFVLLGADVANQYPREAFGPEKVSGVTVFKSAHFHLIRLSGAVRPPP